MPPTKPRISTLGIFTYLFALIIFVIYLIGIWRFRIDDPQRFYFLLTLGSLGLVAVFIPPILKRRRIAKIQNNPFPISWRNILSKQVAFYQKLAPSDTKRFEKAVQFFLATTRITGINTEIDDETKVLIAASAVIPIFGFTNWEYRNLKEVLVYPGAFNGTTFAQEGPGRKVLGMVGTGAMNGKMILSKPALVNGFQRSGDGHNTGVHEFVHLLDGTDGEFDGIPALLDKKYILPWLGLMHREMKRINRGKSKLRPYGATNKAEFFAVASEFFFERPDELKLHYPKLYDMLKKIFQQDLKRQFSPAILRKLNQQ